MTRIVADFTAFLCIAAAALLFMLWKRDARGHVLGRLRNIAVEAGAAGSVSAVRPDVSAGRFLPRFLAKKWARAGLHVSPRTGFAWGGVFHGLILVSYMFAGPLAAAMNALVLILVGAAAVEFLAQRRTRLLSAALRGYFERVRQLLATGMSLSVALQRAVDGSPRIVSDAFAPAMRRIANGAGFAECMNQLADEVDLHEMHLFATAVGANVRFGGSLSGVVANLVENIRKRAGIEREMRAATSQIRTSAWTLGLLPLLVAALVVTRNHDYARWFLDTPAGRTMLSYCVVSQVAGAFVMRLMIRPSY